MPKRIVILGGGTGGTLTANRLRRLYNLEAAVITVVDQDDRHVYQPGLLFVPFGLTHPEDIVRPRERQLRIGIEFVESEIEHVDIDACEVHLANGATLGYDVLVVAIRRPPGSRGDRGSARARVDERRLHVLHAGRRRRARRGARDVRPRAAGGQRGRHADQVPGRAARVLLPGRLVLHRTRYPRPGRRSPTPRPSTERSPSRSPPASSHGMLEARGIELVTEFNTGEVAADGKLIGYDGREIPFDLAVVIPLHGGAQYVGRSPGLGDELDFVPTDEHTLQSKCAPNVFVIGDAANVPASKAGSVTHFEGETLVDNVRHFLAGEPLEAGFDGHANCFIETGFHKALLIDFNYDTEPLPGHYPGEGGSAAPEGVARQPPRQAAVPVRVLARAASRPRPPRSRLDHADGGQATARVPEED